MKQPLVNRSSAMLLSRDRKGAVGVLPALLLALTLTGCGYHVAGTANLIPNVYTIAVPAWTNAGIQYKLSDHLADAVTRELITRTRYSVVSDPAKADAVLSGAVANMISSATVVDSTGAAAGRSTAGQLVVYLQVRLIDKNGQVLFSRPNLEFRERYEISIDPKQYFDESQPAMQRLSKDVAHAVVSAILEKF
jgi:outer membrane lipopolysaccharide assembly protein LptE/RlpB